MGRYIEAIVATGMAHRTRTAQTYQSKPKVDGLGGLVVGRVFAPARAPVFALVLVRLFAATLDQVCMLASPRTVEGR